MKTQDGFGVGSVVRARLSGYFSRCAALGAAAVIGVGTAGCGESPGGIESVEGESQGLRCFDTYYGVPINDPNCPWRYISQLYPGESLSNDITHKLAPAHIGTNNGFLAVTVDTSDKYRVLQWHSLGKGPNWGGYGNRTFASKPTATLREDGATNRPGFVIAGRGKADNKIYASAGTMAEFNAGTAQGNPTAATVFEAVSNTAYSSGGNPALGSLNQGSSMDGVVLVFMSTNNRTIQAHFRQLPYVGSSWSSLISGPTLPSGWNVIGTPAIVRLPITYQIVVHARNGTQDRLYETHFFSNGGEAYFSSNIGSPSPSWTHLSLITGTIDDDPALTNSNALGVTLYFRRGDQLMQTTGFPTGSNPLLEVGPAHHVGNPFRSGPSASANYSFDRPNSHIVVARTSSNKLYWADSIAEDEIVP